MIIFAVVVVAITILACGIFGVFRSREPVVKDCEHGYHEWGMWETLGYTYQFRRCTICGFAHRREIKND